MKLYLFPLKADLVLLPKKIMEHINSYQGKRKDASYAIWSKICGILKRDYLIDINDDNIIFNENGKPDLCNLRLHFSLSHSDEYGAILIADEACGVDIERSFDNLKLADKILNEQEKREFKKSNNLDYLNKKWVMKEAYTKALGLTLFSSKVKEKTLLIDKVINFKNYYVGYYPLNDCQIIEL